MGGNLEEKREKKKIRKICCIPVKKGVTIWNIMAIPLVPILVMVIGTFLNAQIIFLLRNPNYFQVEKIGLVSSSLIFYSMPGALLATLLSGVAFDVIGRRITLVVSFLVFFGHNSAP